MNRSFLFDWKMALFSGIFFSLFIVLGFWQLDRASEKEVIIAADETRRNQSPVPITDAPSGTGKLNGLPVLLHGQYETGRFFLLDNRVLGGKVGFELLLPFRLSSGQLVLVNRGFVVMGRTRDETPFIPELKAVTVVEGNLYLGQHNRFSLREDGSEETSWPRIVQDSDPEILQRMLGENLYPHVVRLKFDDPNALPRYWPTTVMQPLKHEGYAFQWFAMAVAITLAFTFFSFSKLDD